MRIPIFQVDAFTSRIFSGNPAAVCPLEAWISDGSMQAIAAENNLSETAFFVGGAGRYAIRWFTPVTEVDLCGHATLASAHVIFESDPKLAQIVFQSKSGPLGVKRAGDWLELDFPARPASRAEEWRTSVSEALGAMPAEVWAARDLYAVYGSEERVRSLRPDMRRLADLGVFAVAATAPGGECDFVSRFFAPREGIPEDPVTGSAHCTLAPFWASRLGKSSLLARQVSSRGGELRCVVQGERVLISGQAATYLEGAIQVELG